ncbi:MAG TPA: hypothetical protein PK507_03195 [bacterium]|nr:hypothetical protein [bacterium]
MVEYEMREKKKSNKGKGVLVLGAVACGAVGYLILRNDSIKEDIQNMINLPQNIPVPKIDNPKVEEIKNALNQIMDDASGVIYGDKNVTLPKELMDLIGYDLKTGYTPISKAENPTYQFVTPAQEKYSSQNQPITSNAIVPYYRTLGVNSSDMSSTYVTGAGRTVAVTGQRGIIDPFTGEIIYDSSYASNLTVSEYLQRVAAASSNERNQYATSQGLDEYNKKYGVTVYDPLTNEWVTTWPDGRVERKPFS